MWKVKCALRLVLPSRKTKRKKEGKNNFSENNMTKLHCLLEIYSSRGLLWSFPPVAFLKHLLFYILDPLDLSLQITVLLCASLQLHNPMTTYQSFVYKAIQIKFLEIDKIYFEYRYRCVCFRNTKNRSQWVWLHFSLDVSATIQHNLDITIAVNKTKNRTTYDVFRL